MSNLRITDLPVVKTLSATDVLAVVNSFNFNNVPTTAQITVSGLAIAVGNVIGTSQTTLSSIAGSIVNWNNTYNTVTANSANWSSVYTTVCAYSAIWSGITNFVNLTANWNNSYTTLTSYSATWVNTTSIVNNNSANWNNSYTTLSSNSAFWTSTYNTVCANSGAWSSAVTFGLANALTAQWTNTSNTVSANSASWSSAYTTVCAYSALWTAGGNTAGVYTTVNANSASWGVGGKMPYQINVSTNIGLYASGNTVVANTPLSAILLNILQTVTHPTYTQPTLTISESFTSAYEIGTQITNPQLTLNWVQNDAGTGVGYAFLSSADSINYTSIYSQQFSLPSTLNTSQTFPSYYLTSTVYYEASSYYPTGIAKTNNLGQTDTVGQISANSITSTFTLSPWYSIYVTYDNIHSTPATSSDIRSVFTNTYQSNQYNPNSTITLNQNGTFTRIAFAYPASIYGNTNSIAVYDNNLGHYITPSFTSGSALISIPGQNNLGSTPYYVWTFLLPNNASYTNPNLTITIP